MPVLFATRTYQYLKTRMMAADSRFEDGKIEVRTFPDGERFQRIDTSVRDRDVVFLSGTQNDVTTMELFDACCAISAYGARSLSIVIPYYGYSTMERAKPMSREVVTAKTRARLISAIPEAYFGNRIVLFDLHAEGIPHYFGDMSHQIHARGEPIMQNICKDITEELGVEACVVGATDSGGAKRVEYLAKDLGNWEVAFISKRRISGSETEVTNINIDVEGKHVIIYDDMIRSGSSLVQAAEVFKASGALNVYAILSHGVFTKTYEETAAMCEGKLERIYCTDSHPRAMEMLEEQGVRNFEDLEGRSSLIQVRTCVDVLADAVLHHLPRGWGESQ